MASATFDTFRTFSGPFEPRTYQKILENGWIISGNDGDFEFACHRLDANGNPIEPVCRTSGLVPENEVLGTEHDPKGDGLTCIPQSGVRAIHDTIPDADPVYYGAKVWLGGEGEPPYPAPSEANKPNAVSFALGEGPPDFVDDLLDDIGGFIDDILGIVPPFN